MDIEQWTIRLQDWDCTTIITATSWIEPMTIDNCHCSIGILIVKNTQNRVKICGDRRTNDWAFPLDIDFDYMRIPLSITLSASAVNLSCTRDYEISNRFCLAGWGDWAGSASARRNWSTYRSADVWIIPSHTEPTRLSVSVPRFHSVGR
jgi:hypothetical protein